MGSGTIVVVDEATCIVDMATLLTRYLSDESCGKTIPCRIGMRRLAELGQRATAPACRGPRRGAAGRPRRRHPRRRPVRPGAHGASTRC